MNTSKARWYLRRLQKMSPSEMAWRTADHWRKLMWARHHRAAGHAKWCVDDQVLDARMPTFRKANVGARFEATLREGDLAKVSDEARTRVIAAGDEILAGSYELLGMVRKDMEAPDWFFDPVTGMRAPKADYCFRIDHRSEQVTGNVKQVWELSRMHHLTVLAAAFALSGDERYAVRTARHLRSWWAQNPPLSGINWTSGIEVGLRLIAWVWIRRLLDAWEGAPGLFEENAVALTQIWWHQHYLASFRSRGSSANNHVVAEAAGQLVAALAFDWFSESDRWAVSSSALLEEELVKNTFPSGVNREMAFEYHGFVAELGLIAAAEADHAGRPLGENTWELLGRMLDVVAATVDVRLRAPRQGDSDDGRGLALEPPGTQRWAGLLALGGELFGTPDWWPLCELDATGALVASLAGRHHRKDFPLHRPCQFNDAGLAIMRSLPSEGPEIWCRCDAGPHGFLSIAAHAHADALAVEVRHAGIDILADPGTYCYQGEARWRSYFRSTLGHNTVEIAHRDQSISGGPTLWNRHASSRVVDISMGEDGEVARWSAEHDGYESLNPPASHRRTVMLSRTERNITILDRIDTEGCYSIRMAFHLGPDIHAELRNHLVELDWTSSGGDVASATLHLPSSPKWSIVRGSTAPVTGWYSACFGQKQPSTTILGEETCSGAELLTVLQFHS